MTTQGYKLWTVPKTRTYTINAYGAGTPNGGIGGRVKGNFILNKGDIITIICGQMVKLHMVILVVGTAKEVVRRRRWYNFLFCRNWMVRFKWCRVAGSGLSPCAQYGYLSFI